MPTQRAFSELCRRVCTSLNWELLPTGIVVTWGDGRHQLISLEFFEFEREELVRLSTTIGPISKLERHELITSLKSNAELAHGAIGILGDQLCMTDTLMLELAGEAEIEAAIEFLARMADGYERTIFGTDTN